MSSDEAVMTKAEKTLQTKGLLRWAALFLGELRDGLTMVSMWHFLNEDHHHPDLTQDLTLLDQHAKCLPDCRKGKFLCAITTLCLFIILQ